ncbi:MAG TPA: hypothetical protein VND92_06110 [Vicinamibacterales bacterium]|nr:hypothetical protein [Vicinamibacterales bacterium]
MSFEQELNRVAYGHLEPAGVRTVADRLAAIAPRLAAPVREGLAPLLGSRALEDIAEGMLRALDPAQQAQEARRLNELAPGAEPTPAQVAEAADYLLLEATSPLAASPDLRNRLIALDRIY